MSVLASLDIYPKLSDEFRVKTVSGACVSLLALGLLSYLAISELILFLTIDTVSHLYVDTGRGEKLKINFDMTFRHVPCSLLSLDAMDVSGAHQIDISSHIKKQAIDSRGQPIGGEVKHELKSDVAKRMINVTNSDDKQVAVLDITQQPGYCGACYGAESFPGQCCQTCDQVKEGYRMKGWALPPMTNLEQCVASGQTEDAMMLEMQRGDGCNVFGYLEVNKVQGNFHLAPGRTYSGSNVHIHDMSTANGQQFNLTHEIKHLSFGDTYQGMLNPLDGTSRVQEEQAQGAMFLSYIKVVPTKYTFYGNSSALSTNQFSATQHTRHVTPMGNNGLPGVFFFYELSPVKIELTEKRMSIGHFIVQLCAIVGGVYAVAGLVDRVVHQAAKQLEKKAEQGKLY